MFFSPDFRKDILVVRTPLFGGSKALAEYLASPEAEAITKASYGVTVRTGIIAMALASAQQGAFSPPQRARRNGNGSMTPFAYDGLGYRRAQGFRNGRAFRPYGYDPCAPQPPPANGCDPCKPNDCVEPQGSILPKLAYVATVDALCGAIVNVNFQRRFCMGADELAAYWAFADAASQANRDQAEAVAAAGTATVTLNPVAVGCLGVEARVSLPTDAAHGSFLLRVQGTTLLTNVGFDQNYSLQSTSMVSSFAIPGWEVVRTTEMKYRGFVGGEAGIILTITGVPDGTVLTGLSIQSQDREQFTRFLRGPGYYEGPCQPHPGPFPDNPPQLPMPEPPVDPGPYT